MDAKKMRSYRMMSRVGLGNFKSRLSDTFKDDSLLNDQIKRFMIHPEVSQINRQQKYSNTADLVIAPSDIRVKHMDFAVHVNVCGKR